MKVACHARSAEAVKQAVRAGIDFIGHANYIDEEALELLAENKDKLFVGPARLRATGIGNVFRTILTNLIIPLTSILA